MSSIARLANAVKTHAASLDDGLGQPRFASVASVDPVNHSVRVEIQPEGVLTGWLPVSAAAVGAGYGLVAPPCEGDQVLVLPQEGDHQAWVVVGRIFSTRAMPPVVPSAPGGPASAIKPGEIALVSKGGAVLRLCEDGSVYVRAPVFVEGDLRVFGDVFDRHGSLDRLREHYNAHVHTGVRAGGETSGRTPQTD